MITVGASTPLVSEVGKSITVGQVVVDPTFQADGKTSNATVTFQSNTASSNATITRTDGGSFLIDGFTAGTAANPHVLHVTGSANNSTPSGFVYTITNVTATTITLASFDVVQTESTPEPVTLTEGIVPKISTILVLQTDPITANASGQFDITAGKNVLMNSNAGDIRLDHVTAGDTITGDQIRIKGTGSIFNVAGSGVNLRGANTILEAAAGSIGEYAASGQIPITLDSVNGGTITARTQGVVYIHGVAVGGRPGNLNVESIFSAGGDARLWADGSIIDALNNDFTKVEAQNVYLNAGGTIGDIVGGAINYLDINASQTPSGSLTAAAGGNIWISQTTLDMYVKQVVSDNGDVTLRAALSILDDTTPAASVFGNNISLIAQGGGIGTYSNSFDIETQAQNGAYDGAGGTLTTSSNLSATVIVQPTGDIKLNTIDVIGFSPNNPDSTAFITTPTGSILNGNPGGTNVLSGNVMLFANKDIGQQSNRIKTQVGTVEGQSTTGSTWIDNNGALSVGNSFSGNPQGVVSGGSTTITASSPVEVKKSVKAGGQILIVAIDPAGDDVGVETTSDDLTVDSTDLLGKQLTLVSADTIRLLAGDNLTVQQGALTESAKSVELKGGYQGDNTGSNDAFDLKGAPQTTATASDNTRVTVGGTIIAPDILIHGDGGNDVIQVTTGTLSAMFPWANAAAFNAAFTGSFGTLATYPASPSTDSQITLRGEGGSDQILVWGTLTANEIDVYGDGAGDLLALNPDNKDGYSLSINSLNTIGQFNVWGGTSDTLLVNKLNSLDLAHKYTTGATGSGPTSIVTGHESTPLRETVNLYGGNGANNEIINLTGTSDAIINVHRNGAEGGGTDTLTINGGPGTDTFLLRKNFVALLQGTPPTSFASTYERVNYDTSINVLDVNGLEPTAYVYNDASGTVQAQLPTPAYVASSLTSHTNFYVDDNSAITVLTGADGGDTFQFGQMYGEARTGGISVQFGDDVTTVLTNQGYLSRGISFSTTAYGGAGDDSFFVYSNKAPLKLYGEGGNNTFVVRAFVIVNTNSIATDDTTIHTGNGTNHIEYNINAPVSIDGGDGVNTVVVIGSGLGDNFVITRDGVEGAGLNVSMTNVQILEVDGIAGNNNFYVLSTAPGEVVTLIGGAGNDTFNVAGDVTTPIIAENTSGVSGFINHSVSSLDPAYNGIFANGVPVNVATGQTGTVVASTPTLQVFKDPTLGPNVATYTVSLAAPASTVAAGTIAYMTVAASLRPYNLSAQGAKSIEVSTDGIHYYQSIVLTFNQSTNWNAPQTIYVRADQDNVAEGEQTLIIGHSIQSANPLFNQLPISNVEVDVVDNNQPDVIVTQAHPGNLNVVEGTSTDPTNPFPGVTDSYTIELTRAPLPGETVTVTLNSDIYSTLNHLLLSSADPRFNASNPNAPTITFNASNWNSPVTVNVAAYDGATLDDVREADITQAVTSTGGLYANVTSQHKVRVNVTDSELAQVLVTPGSNPMIVSASQTATYTLELTKQPTALVTVSLLSDGKTIETAANPGDTRFTPASGANPPTVTFNSSNWDIPFSVLVSVNPDFTLTPTVNFDKNANTITLTSAGSWLADGLAAGQFISVEGANGQTTVSRA